MFSSLIFFQLCCAIWRSWQLMASNGKAPEKIDSSLSFQILKWRAFWRKLWDKGLRRSIWVERSNLGTIKRAGWRWSRSNCIRCPFVQLDQSVHPPFKLADRQSWSWCSWTGCPPSRGERSQEARTQRGGGQQCWQASSDNPKLGPARPIFAPFSPPGRSKLGPFTCQVRTKGIRRGEDKRLTDSDKGIRGRKSFDSECTLQVNENIQAWGNTYESNQIQFLNCFPSLEKNLYIGRREWKKGLLILWLARRYPDTCRLV